MDGATTDGELVRLREQARFELGPVFDIRRYHDAVLSSGALPLSVLQQHVAWFIDGERAGGVPGICGT